MEKESKIITLFTLFVFALFIFLLFFRLGDPKLTNWDEAWYGDISRNMAETRNLITPVFNHEPFFDKPPLYFWLTTLSFKLFGVSEFSQRFFSAASGFGTGIVLYFLARLLFNNYVAIISLIALSSTTGFLYRARTGNLDTLLAFFILLSIFAFYKGQKKKHSGLWFLLFGLAVGLGFLTKGAISFLFPFIVIVYGLYRKDFSLFKRTSVAIFIAIVISLSWIGIYYLANGYPFIRDFYINQTTKVYETLLFWKNFSLDYIFHLKSGLKFLFLLFIPSFIYCLSALRKKLSFLIILYFIIFLGILLFSKIVSNWFLMPLYPITSIIIGYSVFSIIKFFGKKSIPFFILALFIISLLQIFYYRWEFFYPDISYDEAKVAIAAKKFTNEDDILYLTNYYYPTTIFYSERKTYALYEDFEQKSQSWWIKPKREWKTILKNKRVFVVTTKEDLKNLQEYFSAYKFETLYQSGEKLLLKKV